MCLSCSNRSGQRFTGNSRDDFSAFAGGAAHPANAASHPADAISAEALCCALWQSTITLLILSIQKQGYMGAGGFAERMGQMCLGHAQERMMCQEGCFCFFSLILIGTPFYKMWRNKNDWRWILSTWRSCLRYILYNLKAQFGRFIVFLKTAAFVALLHQIPFSLRSFSCLFLIYVTKKPQTNPRSGLLKECVGPARCVVQQLPIQPLQIGSRPPWRIIHFTFQETCWQAFS